MHTTYRLLDLVPIPELVIEARDSGVVDFVYDGDRGLHVEIAREDGTTAGFVQLEACPVSDGAYSWCIVAYS